jgi:hypothetical protein
MLYIADAGLNQEVTSIASVSGGSITNGYVGANVDYRTVNPAQFRDVITPLVKRCSVLGTVQWAWESVTLCVTVVLGIGLAVAAWLVPVAAFLHAALFIIGLVLALAAIQARSWVADRVFRRLLFSSTSGRPIRLADLNPGVTHVLCATEVQSAEHAYFSRAFCASYKYGVSEDAGALPLSTAVQCSACFPGGFPARSLSAKRLGFTAQSSPLLLVDGGVYDNMGDQWAQGFADRIRRWPGLAELAGPAPENLVVVNASTRSDWSPSPAWARVPLLGEIITLLREKSILYQVGTATRRSNLIDRFNARRLAEQLPASAESADLINAIGMGGALVHIGSSAAWTRNAVAAGTGSPACAAVAAALDAFPDQEWIEQAPLIAARVKTTLAKIGKTPAAALIWHGYVLTMANLHVFHDTPLLELPTRQQLEQMTA